MMIWYTANTFDVYHTNFSVVHSMDLTYPCFCSPTSLPIHGIHPETSKDN